DNVDFLLSCDGQDNFHDRGTSTFFQCLARVMVMNQFKLLIPKNDNILPNPWNYIKKTLFSKMIQSGKSF
ncbi:hypothetical protein, partial [Brevibacillus agri]|nr:hypothetical protein [Brevibacillus agri]